MKNRVPFAHPIDTYRKCPEVFMKNDPNPFEWIDPKWLKGEPEELPDPRPIRSRMYFKIWRLNEEEVKENGKWVWRFIERCFPVVEDGRDRDEARQLIAKAFGATRIEDSNEIEFKALVRRLRNAKLYIDKHYEI
jgi:hypothetical protein